jgi:hypothetical protein
MMHQEAPLSSMKIYPAFSVRDGKYHSPLAAQFSARALKFCGTTFATEK